MLTGSRCYFKTRPDTIIRHKLSIESGFKMKYLNICITVIKFVKVSFCRSINIQVKKILNMFTHFPVTCLKMEFTFTEYYLEVHRAFQWCILFIIFKIKSCFKFSYVENLGSQIQRLKSSDAWKWIGTLLFTYAFIPPFCSHPK